MLESLFAQALESQPFTVAAFLLGIVALWKAYKGSNTSRINALEKGLKSCLSKHTKCEHRNQLLVMAVVDAAAGRSNEALQKCHTLLNEPEEDEGV